MGFTLIVRLGAGLIVLALLSLPGAYGQPADTHTHELESRVQVLDDFHEVIFQIWHTAWPEKNVAMLVELLPQVKQYSDTLARVTLTGILRDKQDAWDAAAGELTETVTAYEAATSPLDSTQLLDAAERLHAQFEALVRVVRPVTKELDQFHQVLYMIYHHYWPGREQAKLIEAVASLKERMAALEQSTLPARLKSRTEAFEAARADLAAAVAAIEASDAAGNPEKFAEDLETVHGAYQSVEGVFD